jgi:hypothetical protein
MNSSKSYYGVLMIAAAVAVAVALPGLVSAQVRGVSYSFSPTASAMSWNKQSGLDGGYMYGGQLGFGFGRYVELSGLYMVSTGVETNIGGIDFLNQVAYPRTPSNAEIFQRRDADITRYGGNLTFNIGSGIAIPYVSAGTGIVGINPENRPKSEHIYLSGGAGLKFSVDDRFTLNIGVDNMWYRYNPAKTFMSDASLNTLGIDRSSVQDKEIGNWALTAGVTGYLGGRNPSHMSDLDIDLQRQFSGGFRGISLIVEPTIAVIQFNDKLPYRADQRVAGGSAGFDFGPYVGIRGFYLRGLEEDEWTKFDTFAMYGGEMKFRLNDASTGLVPFLSIGAGYIDVNNEYEGRGVATDKPFALGGGGIELKLNDNFKLFGSAKAVLVSNDDLGDINATESISNSWMFNGGLSFALGAKRKTNVVRYSDAERRIIEATSARDREILDLREQVAREQAKSATISKKESMADSMKESHKFITLPVLEDGEIYIRFGKTASMKVVSDHLEHEKVGAGSSVLNTVDIEQLRSMIQSILRETLKENGIITTSSRATRVDTVIVVREVEQRQQATQDAGRTELQIKVEGAEVQKVDEKAIEDRVVRRIAEQQNENVQKLQKEIAELQKRLDSQATSVSAANQQAAQLRSEAIQDDISRDRNTVEKLNLEGMSVTAGFNLAGKPFQFLIGIRADYGDVFGGRFILAPDATLGFINTMSYNMNLNFITDVRVDSFDPWRPYAGFGVGILGFSEPPESVKGVQGTFNLLIGAEKPVGEKNAIFLEYMNMNLFKFNRLQAGYRFAFK